MVICLWGRWLEVAFFAATLHLFARNGTSDILYYWLDGRAIPQRLDWLDANQFVLFKPVIGEALILSSAIWISVWVLAWLMVGRLAMHRQ